MYGLRLTSNASVFLAQIAGDGRFLLSDGIRSWWSKRKQGQTFEVYPALKGQTYPTEAQASEVAGNLNS